MTARIFQNAEVKTDRALIDHISLDEGSYRSNGKSVVRIAVENTFREKTTRITNANA